MRATESTATVRVRASHRGVALGPSDPRHLGRWQLVGRLGQGGMGTVNLGVDASARTAAIKVVHPHLASDASFMERFRREASLATQVDSRF